MGRRVWLVGALALLSAFVIACGSESREATPDEVADGGGGAAGILPASGEELPPGQYLTFEGERYELQTIAFEEEVAGQLEAVGEIADADLDVGDGRVFRRAGDATKVYTYVEATIEDPGHWLVWSLVA